VLLPGFPRRVHFETIVETVCVATLVEWRLGCAGFDFRVLKTCATPGGLGWVGLERVTNEIPTTATVNRAETQPTFVLAVI
jgi:hypothetical protein